MEVAILIFDGMTALDAVGPYEVLSRLPMVDVKMVAKSPGPKRSDLGSLAISADVAISDVLRPEVVVIAGGTAGVAAAVKDAAILEWVRLVHETTLWTTSVCTGALILGAAGLLEGRAATTHWRALDLLGRFGALPRSGRVIEDGRIITSAGVSAGIDMAFVLAEKIGGTEMAKAIRLSMDYQLESVFEDADPARAPAAVRQIAMEGLKRVASGGRT